MSVYVYSVFVIKSFFEIVVLYDGDGGLKRNILTFVVFDKVQE